MSDVDRSSCLVCRGTRPCKFANRADCPMLLKSNSFYKVQEFDFKKAFSSDAPGVFVGHTGYPKVNVGFLTPPEKLKESWLLDAPKAWAQKSMSIPQVVDFRSSLINSRFTTSIKDTNKMVDMAQEVSQASKPVDLEVDLKKKPEFQSAFDSYVPPTGPNANVDSVKITSNASIKKQVEKRVSDTDLKAGQAVSELFEKGYDENFLMRLLSMGNVGVGKNRKLVPTRWSITAVDDTLGKDIIDFVRDKEQIEPCLYFGGFMGNYFIIMLFEYTWQYELFEMYMPDDFSGGEVPLVTDYENFEGRKNYAEATAGGYYAARIGGLEYLKQHKKQGSCLMVRFITNEYSVPLGVWVVRSAVRKALEGKKHSFETKEKMLEYASFIAKKRFNYDLSYVMKQSLLYENIKKQTKLQSFL